MPRNLVRLFAMLAVAVLMLGACGDDDGGDAAPTTTAAPGDTADDGDGPGDDDSDTTTTVSPGGGSERPDLPNLAAIDDFCDLFVQFDDFDDEAFFGDDPDMSADESAEAMAEGFRFMEALFARAVQLAPNEIRADMALFASTMSDYNDLLAEYDYDFMAMAMASMDDPELEERFAALDSAELDAASDRIEGFVLAECGIDLGE